MAVKGAGIYFFFSSYIIYVRMVLPGNSGYLCFDKSDFLKVF